MTTATFYPSSTFPVQFINPDTGALAAGFTLSAYLEGTSTPTPMYTDKTGTSAGTSVTTNSAGYPEVSGSVVVLFLDYAINYKFILRDDLSGTEWTIDGIPALSNTNYASVADMVSDSLASGLIVQTDSYYAFGGFAQARGGARYQIMTDSEYTTATGFNMPDELFDHTLSNGNIARCLFPTTGIQIEQGGARLDGVTDDSPVFNSASERLEATGGTIHIGPGTAIIDDQVLVLGAIKWVGAGRRATTIKLIDDATATGSNAGYIFDTFYRNDVTFQDMTFDGNLANQSDFVAGLDNGASGVVVRNSENVNFINCGFKDFGKDGIWCFDVRGSDVSISGATRANPCVITTSTNHGLVTDDWIRITGVAGMTELNDVTYRVTKLTDTTFSLDDTDAVGFSTYISGGTVSFEPQTRNVNVTSCYFDNIFRFGVTTISSAKLVVDGCFFRGGARRDTNDVVGNGGVTWESDSPSEQLQGVSITNCHFENMKLGVRLTNLVNSTDIKGCNVSNNYFKDITTYAPIIVHQFGTNGAIVKGNTCVDCGTDVVSATLYELAGGVLFTGTDNIIIDANIFWNCVGTKSTVYSEAGGINAIITNNQFNGDKKTGIWVQSPTGSVANGGSKRIVTGNILVNGGQDQANTHPAIVLSNFAESQENGGDLVDGNVIHTSTTDGYGIGIRTFDDDGSSYYGNNRITGNGTDYSVSSGQFPIREYEQISSGANNTSGALTQSVTFTANLRIDTVELNIPPIIGTTGAANSITLGYLLPERFRPVSDIFVPVASLSNGTTQADNGLVEITTAGQVTIYYSSDRSSTWPIAANSGVPRICAQYRLTA